MNPKKLGIIFLALIALVTLLGCVNHCNVDTPRLCNQSCLTSEDCKYECGAGCINKAQPFDNMGTVFDCVNPPGGCTCIDKKCALCIGEGGTIPVIADPPECCPGLTLIPPMKEGLLGIIGYCTAKCGNETCNQIETNYNCPEDCDPGPPEPSPEPPEGPIEPPEEELQ